jgi:hypothetical protein
MLLRGTKHFIDEKRRITNLKSYLVEREEISKIEDFYNELIITKKKL